MALLIDKHVGKARPEISIKMQQVSTSWDRLALDLLGVHAGSLGCDGVVSDLADGQNSCTINNCCNNLSKGS